jgi:high affinity Mn2+ porin
MSKITGQTAAKSVSNMRPLRTYLSGSYSEAIDLTLLNQFLKNLTHNADRGPVSIFSARLHGEF